jgi:RHS repeat-associated protein
MKKHSYRKQLSILLVIALVVTSFPSYVLANTGSADQTSSEQSDSLIKYDPNYKGKIEIVEELPFKRGEFEKHFVNTDGSMIAVSYPEAVHYQVNGTWEDIDSRLVVKDKEKGLYGPAASDLQVLLPGSATADILVPATKSGDKDSVIKLSSNYLTKVTDGEYSISWNILGNSKDYTSDFLSQATSKTLDNELVPISTLTKSPQPDFSTLSHDEQKTALPNLVSTAVYKNIVKNVDLSVTVTPNKLKENLILSSPKGFANISYLIDAGNLIGKINDDNSVCFSNERGDVVFIIPTPLMLDSNTIPEESLAIGLALEKTKAGYILTLTPDTKWLNDPARVYPVTIDPTVTTSRVTSNILDTYVHSGDSAGDHKYSSYIKINKTESATCRGYIDFANRPSINTTTNYIIGGDLITYLVSGTSTYNPMTVYQPTAAWTTGGITWANKPSNSAPITTKNAAPSGSYYKYTFPVDASVKSWYSTGVQNGYMIKYETESINDYNYFYASDHPTISSSYYPCIIIEYAADTTAPTLNVSVTPTSPSNLVTTDPATALWYGNNITLTASATDGGVGVNTSSYQFVIDKLFEPKSGGGYNQITYNGSSYTFSETGKYRVKVTVKDKAGNTATKPSATTEYYYVYIDKKVPHQTPIPPNGEQQIKYTTNGSSVTVDVWMTDSTTFNGVEYQTSGLGSYKLSTATSYTSIAGAPKDKKITVTIPTSNPIATLYVKDAVGKEAQIPLDAGDVFAPNIPSIIQRNGSVEIFDNLDIKNSSGATGPCTSFQYKIGSGSYTLYNGPFKINRNIDNTIYAKAFDANGNFSGEGTLFIPKEIGIYKENATDISYDQLAAPLSIRRTYKSNTNTWYFSFDTQVSSLTSRVKSIKLQNGELKYYTYVNSTTYQGEDEDDLLIISDGYYCVNMEGYYFVYYVSTGKLRAIYSNSAATTPIALFTYDSSGIHIAAGEHTININTAKTSVEVKKGTEVLATASYTYNSGQLESMTDAMGRTKTFTYSNGHLASTTMGSGGTNFDLSAVQYYSSGDVEKITYAGGEFVEYTYQTSSAGDITITKTYSNTTTEEEWVENSTSSSGSNYSPPNPFAPEYTITDEGYYEYCNYVDDQLVAKGTIYSPSTVYTKYADVPAGTFDELYLYYYDTEGQVTREDYSKKQDGTYFHINTYSVYDATGRLNIEAVLRDQSVTPITSYSASNLNIYSELMEYLYDSSGNLTSEKRMERINGVLTQTSRNEYVYDSFNRVTTKTEIIGTGTSNVTETDCTYNGFGYLVQEEVSHNGGSPEINTYSYDQYGQQIKKVMGAQVTRNVYDAFGRIAQEIPPSVYSASLDTLTLNSESMASNSGVYTGSEGTKRYLYYIENGQTQTNTWNVDSIIEEDGNETSISYDAVGNVLAKDFDNFSMGYNITGTKSGIDIGNQPFVDYEYNSETNKISKWKAANAQFIQYNDQNNDGNIDDVYYGDGQSSENAFSYEHSPAGNVTKTINSINQTQTMFSTNGFRLEDMSENLIYEYNSDTAYDLDGTKYELIQQNFGLDSMTSKYYGNYDLLQLGNANELKKQYTYSGEQLISTVASINSANLLSTGFTYTNGKVSAISNSFGATSLNYTYGYDSNDRISSATSDGDSTTYTYDAKGQLTRVNDESQNITYIYEYTEDGNIIAKKEYLYTLASPITSNPTSSINYSYGDQNWSDKLTTYDGQTITYDASGNPLSYRGYTFEWKAGRLLDSATTSTKTISFEYDDKGIRTEKTINESPENVSTTKYTTVDGRITSQSDGTNDLYFYYDQNEGLIGVNINGEDYLYVKNMQGDIVAMLDDSGSCVVSYVYDAWGKVLSITGSQAATTGELNPMRYRGYYQDTETGFYYLQSRFYDPETCRMINADSDSMIRDGINALDYNLFAYCHNNPVMNIDPEGTFTLRFIGCGIQIELSFGPICAGAEIVWYTSTRIQVSRSRLIPYLYYYGGAGASKDLSTVISKITNDPSKLFNRKAISGFNGSVSIFAIWANVDQFQGPKDYYGYIFNAGFTAAGKKFYSEWNKTTWIVGVGLCTNFGATITGGRSYTTSWNVIVSKLTELSTQVKKTASEIDGP